MQATKYLKCLLIRGVTGCNRPSQSKSSRAKLKMAPGNSVGIVGGGGGGGRWGPADETTTSIRALVATTGEKKWEYKMVGDSWTGTLVTAGGLVFSADAAGNFFALNAETGEPLWHLLLGAAVRSNPVSYAGDGKQYVVDSAGNTLFALSLP